MSIPDHAAAASAPRPLARDVPYWLDRQIERLYPGFPVTLSSHVLPEFREYERALTACMNSYVRPKVADYVARLQSELQSIGAKADVNILRSDAGLMTTREAARNPIYAVLSGPSGGVAGALFVGWKLALPTEPAREEFDARAATDEELERLFHICAATDGDALMEWYLSFHMEMPEKKFLVRGGFRDEVGGDLVPKDATTEAVLAEK